jgi:two-component system, chemotaxis family, chemotaxis protein CheY
MPAASALQIMVVDDQRAMRALVREGLIQLGCRTITECGDGVEALRALDLRKYHLIVSDLNMPNLDGLGLLEAVRAKPGHEKTAFIMLTSRGEIELVKRAIALGVNNYITKPFTMGGLKAKVEAVFGPLT